MTTGGSNAQQLDPAGAGTGEHSDAPVRWLATNGDAADFIELHFTDVAGTLKSVVLPRSQLEETLAYGHWFDGSALEGGARLLETDLLLRPDLRTWGLLPWVEATGERTGRFICDVATPAGEPYPADPRAVLRRVVQEAAELGFHYHVASEVEFFLLRQPRITSQGSARPLDSGGYFDQPLPPAERPTEAMVAALEALGVPVDASHHEIGQGQHEIDLPLLPALEAADALVTCKFVVKSIARRRGLLATFMPKPLAETAGSGLHLHQVLADRQGQDAFWDPADEHGLSATARAFLAGQLAHARAMCAVLAPTVNSYKRLGRGFDAPSTIGWSDANPQAMIRLSGRRGRRQAHRPDTLAGGVGTLALELRCPDPSCNPYLALAVALAAGLDGIRSAMEPPAPLAPPPAATAEEEQVELLPVSLGEAIGELEWDPVVRAALGAPVYERLVMAKEQEWQAYRRQISAWELERYLESS
jgi:glutamine synthetase